MSINKISQLDVLPVDSQIASIVPEINTNEMTEGVIHFAERMGINIAGSMAGAAIGGRVGAYFSPMGAFVGAGFGGAVGGFFGEVGAQKYVDGVESINWGAALATGLVGGISCGAGSLASGAVVAAEGSSLKVAINVAKFISATGKTGFAGVGQRAAVNIAQGFVYRGSEAFFDPSKNIKDVFSFEAVASDALFGEAMNHVGHHAGRFAKDGMSHMAQLAAQLSAAVDRIPAGLIPAGAAAGLMLVHPEQAYWMMAAVVGCAAVQNKKGGFTKALVRSLKQNEIPIKTRDQLDILLKRYFENQFQVNANERKGLKVLLSNHRSALSRYVERNLQKLTDTPDKIRKCITELRCKAEERIGLEASKFGQLLLGRSFTKEELRRQREEGLFVVVEEGDRFEMDRHFGDVK